MTDTTQTDPSPETTALRTISRQCVYLAIAIFALGCQVADKKPESYVVQDVQDKPDKFILLGAGKYEGKLSFALVKQGFDVKPIAVTQEVVDLDESNRLVKYREAGYRYGLKVDLAHDRTWGCAFSSSHRVDVTMSVIDVQNNDTLAIVHQVGPDGPCPPLTPVWTLLAEELHRIW